MYVDTSSKFYNFTTILLMTIRCRRELTSDDRNRSQRVLHSLLATQFTGDNVLVMEERDVVKEVLSNLRGYLRGRLPVDVDFLSRLQDKHLLAEENAHKLRTAVEAKGGKSGVDGLLDYMSSFYDEETLEKFCVFLEEYSQPARPLLSKIAKRIREDLKE